MAQWTPEQNVRFGPAWKGKGMMKVFALAMSIIVANSSVAHAEEWKKITQSTPPAVDEWLGGGGDLRAILALSTSRTLVAVGNRGLIRRSDDGGSTWSDKPSRTEAELHAIAESSDHRTLIAVGAQGAVLRSSDQGETWDALTQHGTQDLFGIAAVPNTNIVVAVGANGTVLRGIVDGDQVMWDAPKQQGGEHLYGITTVPSIGVAATNTGIVVAVGTNGTVLRGVVNHGQVTWDAPIRRGIQRLFGVVAVPNTNIMVAVGDSGTVLRGTVSGDQVRWDPPTRPGDASLFGIAAVPNTNIVVAVGEYGTVLRGVVERDQVRWNAPRRLVNRSLFGIAAVPNTNTVVAVGDDVNAPRGTVSGDQVQWDLPTRPGDQALNGIATVPNANILVAVGDFGTVLRGMVDRDQVRWDPPTQLGKEKLFGIAAVPNTNIVVAVGANGTVLRGVVHGDQVRWDPPAQHGTKNLFGIAAVPNASIVVAVGANGTVLRGVVGVDQVRWDPPAQHGTENLFGIAAVPNANIVVAVGANGTVLRGVVDGGQVTWDPPTRQGNQDLTGISAVPNTKIAVAIGAKGTVLRGTASSGQVRWDELTPQVNQPLFGVAAVANTKIIVAVGQSGTVLLSTDRGLNWARQIVHVTNTLKGAAPLRDHIVAVGGPISNLRKPASVAAADEYRFSSTGDNLTFAWRYPPGVQATCSAAYYDIVDKPENDRAVIRADLNILPSTEGRIGFIVTWPPADRSIARGTKFRYFVECTDLALKVTWRQEIPEIQQYAPPPTVLEQILAWINARPQWLQSLLAVAGLVALWCGLLLGLWCVAPQKLVALHERLPAPKTLDQAVEAADKLTAGLSKALRLVGVAALLRLGASGRALDAWISARLPEARDRFTRLKVVQDRRIALDLPIMLDALRLDQPWSALDTMFRKPSVSLLIAGPGGAGKTTLACRIGCRTLGEEGTPPGGVFCLPLLIDRDLEISEAGDGFLLFLAGALRAMLGIPRLSSKLAEALARSGRLLVIVDGLSERNEATRRAFDPARPDFPIMRLIVTSRDAERANMGAVIETLAIPPDALYSFIARYIDEAIARAEIETQLPYEGQRPSEAEIHDACAQLKRLLRGKPTTPLFAAMWAEEIRRSGKTAATRVQSVAELIDSYVERLLTPAAGGNAVLLDNLRLDLAAIASRELGEDLTPGWLTRTHVLDALRERAADSPEKRIDILLDSRLLEADSRNSELIRIALDPIAEHLVARSRVEAMAGDAGKWRSFLDLLKQRGWPAGFVEAVCACLEARGYGRPAYPVPDEALRGLLDASHNGPAAGATPPLP